MNMEIVDTQKRTQKNLRKLISQNIKLQQQVQEIYKNIFKRETRIKIPGNQCNIQFKQKNNNIMKLELKNFLKMWLLYLWNLYIDILYLINHIYHQDGKRIEIFKINDRCALFSYE
ncbi:unnamed protein product [Paramecium sonneborni]|uniref:Transmembrane protein n=1 Tax=Paramecium sonneborni TaxID=65129 RepID=A0A8S1NJD6_9CILI|nr:unnamed protein product [Paramecium sonneborni]